MKRERLTGQDISLGLLVALAELPPAQRRAWVGWYVGGVKEPSETGRRQRWLANQRLREFFGSPERLRDAA